MKAMKSFTILSLSIGLALVFSACNPGTGTIPTLDPGPFYTAAVQTVEAQQTQTAIQATIMPLITTATPTATQPGSAFAPTLTPSGDPGSSDTPCLAANFISDISYPDGSIVAPGATFTKTWRVKNSGTCTWDSSYSLVFVGGYSMGALTVIPLQRTVTEDQIVDLSVMMVAPTTPGYYEGYWRLQTPWGGSMGFGPYDSPLSVKVYASSTTDFAVTTVIYNVTRYPLFECDLKVWFYIDATIVVNGPTIVEYHWERNDGYPDYESHDPLQFESAGSKTVRYSWILYQAAFNKTRWVSIYIEKPNNQSIGRAEFIIECP